MLFLGTILIPIVAILIASLFFKRHFALIEYFCLLLCPLTLILISYFTLNFIQTNDKEYWSGWITKAEHSEPWNEYVHKTCTRTVGTGKDAKTETYDCSYVRYHPDVWHIYGSNGEELDVPENKFLNLVNLFGNRQKTGHHSGYTNSGDIFTTYWNGSDPTQAPLVTVHNYKNKVQHSHNIINFPEISKKEAKKLGLFEYPNLNDYYALSILGWINPYDQQKLDKLNSNLGARKQVKVWILVYQNKPMSIFQDQLNYWKNGNKNEFVIGIGLKDGKVQWTDVFTWSESHLLKAETKNKLAEQIGNNLNLSNFIDWLYPEIEQKWKRKEFKDFDYLTVEFPFWNVFVVYLLTSLSTVGCFFYMVGNDYKQHHCSVLRNMD